MKDEREKRCLCRFSLHPSDFILILRMRDGDIFFGWSAQTPGGMRLWEETPEEMLIDLVTRNVQPADWCDRGGMGTVSYFPMGKSLIINQPAEIQKL